VSFYTDDVVLFLQSTSEDISITMDILQVFGEISGLCNNAQKSSIFPIRCDESERDLIHQLLPCPLSEFPCHYLEMPLPLKKLTRDQLQPIFDRIADQLPGWKAYLLTKPGRRILVQFVMTGMLIYLAMAINLPAWGQKAVGKLQRGFLWRGCKEAKEDIVWCMEQGMQTDGAQWPWNLELKRAQVGTKDEMAMVGQDRPYPTMVNIIHIGHVKHFFQ
jgi:hypothetical protein